LQLLQSMSKPAMAVSYGAYGDLFDSDNYCVLDFCVC
jgi:hypothetical protein